MGVSDSVFSLVGWSFRGGGRGRGGGESYGLTREGSLQEAGPGSGGRHEAYACIEALGMSTWRAVRMVQAGPREDKGVVADGAARMTDSR